MLIHFPLLSQLSVSAWLWGILYLLTASTLSAQTVWKPLPVILMAYTTIDEKTFYVHGGVSETEAGELQFFSLDLTQDSWDVSNPPWKQLPYSNVFGNIPVSANDHALTVSPDGQTLSLWIGGVLNQFANYSVTDNKWTRLPINYWFEDELRAATDPSTGDIYFPAGYPKKMDTMVKIDRNLNPTTEAIPPSVNFTKTGHSFIWNKLRNSFILNVSGPEKPLHPFHEYTPSNGQWKALNTTGSNPGSLRDSCMVNAYEGTKIIVFGGFNGFLDIGKAVGDIYILDVPSLKWKKGRSAPVPRNMMACTVAGDNFISWGGYNTSLRGVEFPYGTGTPLIYNIKSDQWVKKYVRGSSYKPSSAPLPSPTNGINPPPGDTGVEREGEGPGADGDIKGVSGATIGGGVAGGVIVVAAIAFIFVRRRRQSRDQRRNSKHPEYNPHYQYNNTNHPEYTPYHDQELPSMGDTDTRPFVDTRFKWTQIQETPSSPQVIRNDPQRTPSSPHSTLPSPLASFPSAQSSPSPSRLNDSFQLLDRQKRVRSMDRQLLAIQKQIGLYRNDPQFDPTIDQALPTRGPQTGHEEEGVEGREIEPASDLFTQDLRYQIQTIEKELNRRGAM
ncbi:Multiple epidermal growth factor-like domains protein 8 [Linnemannia zychae]|nr:Multiple epidermal growth factor-like domains protein 8 [Linnemannia zychae]